MGRLNAIVITVSFFLLTLLANAQISYTLKPSSAQFEGTVGMPSHNVNFVLTNTSKTTFTIQSISIDSPVFQLVTGWAPYTLVPTEPARYGINFVPTSAGTFSGHLIINIDGLDPISIPLFGSAVRTGATVSVNTSSLSFTQPVGVTSAPADRHGYQYRHGPADRAGGCRRSSVFRVRFCLAGNAKPGQRALSAGHRDRHSSRDADQFAHNFL